MIKLKLSKYHSCENTFLITMLQKNKDYSQLAINLCSKEKYDTDGLLILNTDPIEVFFYNKDGTEANMCGNGLNSMMHYCYDKFKIYKYLKFKTKAGEFECEMLKKDPFYSCVNLGMGNYYKNIIREKVFLIDKEYEVSMFELGVLHAIILVDDLKNINANEVFENNFFDKKANINFVKIINNNTIEIITYEKGVGITKACGTGAGASSYIMHKYYGLDSHIDVLTLGGILKVEISDNIYLKADSVFVMDLEEKE